MSVRLEERAAPRAAIRSWFRTQPARLALVDLGCVVWATNGAQVLRFGVVNEQLRIGGQHTPYALISLAVILVWWLMLGLWGSREQRVLGYGPEEYKRVISATLWLFGGIAIFSYVFQLETARGYVAIALPIGLMSLLAGRWVLRNLLISSRNLGRNLHRVLLIGGEDSVAHLHRQLGKNPAAGYRPVAAYLPGGRGTTGLQSAAGTLPVVGHSLVLQDILDAIEESGVDTVAISAGSAFAPSTLRQLGWKLAARDINMIVAPALTDVAGPRIHTQPVAGLPLIHVTTPKLDGSKRLFKRLFDISASGLALIVLALPMLLVAALIKLDDPGPSIFRQRRIGKAGASFEMLKFRSMVVDAEARLRALREQSEGNGVMFKMKQDPRITRIGRLIRRYSIDELPQFINVLKGDMSLVGPRPPLPSEVEAYDDSAHRRLLVKPGITGLWQVSGRSDLSWEDTVRLDLYYVENWSLTQDLMILVKTFRAVVAKSGAY
ncbi:sugar transferase [Sinomonas halotolerans]|uniref:Sugar transferase n=1 Tax=Sinomonas halotolerans TaxID=1644133 RepID=A0ABU9WYM7_9MICC